jgi:hypothetical protein
MEPGSDERNGAVDAWDAMNGASESHPTEAYTVAPKLDYGRPASPEPNSNQNKITVPVSVLLMMLQVPWLIFAVFGFLEFRTGQFKSLYIDSLAYVFIALPSIGCIAFNARQLFPPHARYRKRAFVFAGLALLALQR